MANILSTLLFPRWQCHAVAECNFLEDHLAAGDTVTVLVCDAMLKACDANPWNSLSHCLACMGLRDNLLEMVSGRIQRLPLISPAVKAPCKTSQFESLESLKKFTWNNAPAGADIVSSLITATGSVAPDTITNRDIIARYLRDYCLTYATALDYLERFKYDKVYIFNGRFASAKAWIRACRERKTNFVTQERFSSPERVTLVDNDGVHNPTAYTERILDFWKANASDPKIAAEARDFFEERPKGLLTGWYSYVSGQSREQLPEGWNPEERNIALFASTESEFMGLPEYFLTGLFPDQRQAYSQLAREFLQDKNFRFYLRVHPNSQQDSIRWWEGALWKNLSNVTIIPPESPVSSYTLMWSCEKTAAWTTTMGVEATYWEKPGILLGNALYEGIDAVYEPRNLSEAVDMIRNPQLPPKPKSQAMAYGAFLRCGLPKLPYSEPITSCKLNFKGRQPNAPPDILTSLWNWENIVSKSRVPRWVKQLWQKWEWHRLKSKYFSGK